MLLYNWFICIYRHSSSLEDGSFFSRFSTRIMKWVYCLCSVVFYLLEYLHLHNWMKCTTQFELVWCGYSSLNVASISFEFYPVILIYNMNLYSWLPKSVWKVVFVVCCKEGSGKYCWCLYNVLFIKSQTMMWFYLDKGTFK